MKVTAEQVEGFVEALLKDRLDDPVDTPDFHREMWGYCCGDEKQVAIAAPRGHAKSTAITFAYLLAVLLFRERKHALIISSNEDMASLFLNDIKAELAENEAIRDLFEFSRFVKERENEIIVQFKDGWKFRVVVKGAEQRMRGIKWERARPDIVIVDDVEDDEIVLNANRRDKFRRWFYGAVKPILKDGGVIRMVGTIIHMDSLLERFMPDEKHADTVITPLKTYSTKPSAWLSVKYRAHDEDYSHILWPENFSEDRLREIRSDFAEQGMLDVYGQEYLNNPIDEQTAFFKREDFIPLKDSGSMTYYAGGDFAISQSERADYTCFKVAGLDAKGILKYVYSVKGRWDARQIMDTMFMLQNRFDLDVFFVEADKIQKAIGPLLYSEMGTPDDSGEIRPFINIEAIVPSKDKMTRAKPLQGRMRAGKVEWDTQADWYPDTQQELIRFPKAPHDDEVDSAGIICLGLKEMVAPPTQTEIDEEEYNESLFQMGYGRSSVTGY